jgi:hypothetical protein
VAQARREWADAGATAEQLARLDAVQVQVADLPGLTLGQAAGTLITIDSDAAGWGWFVDQTPQDDHEFLLNAQGLAATSGPAARHMDLLSVLTHEMGHVLGLDHAADGVMEDHLAAGQRSTTAGAPAADTTAVGAVEAPALAQVAAPAAVPTFSIDWSSAPMRELTGAASLIRGKPSSWQDRFVSHLGATPQRLDPNAALRLHLDVTPRLLAKPAVAAR